VLYAFGLFGFLWKSVIIPSFFVVAYLAGRFRAFVRDWAIYLGAIALFDSCRGLIYGLVLELELPVYMGYAIDLERKLFGDELPSIALQRALFAEGEVGALEKALVAVHASHFLLFLGLGLLIWLLHTEAFARFKLAFVVVMYGGIVTYLLIPTVPPWMAANRFYVLPPIVQMTRKVYNLSVPNLAASFDINPIAAMPSLHAAFPALLTLVCFHHFGRRGAIMVAYLGAVVFGIVYMGEHYIVDVVAGFALALGAYLLAYRYAPLASRLDAAGRAAAGAQLKTAQLRRPLALGALLVVAAQAAGFAGKSLQGREVPTEAFIARELAGKSPMADYYRALNAYYADDCRRAQPLFARAKLVVPNESKQLRAVQLEGECAFRNADYDRVVKTLGTQLKLTRDQALMVAEARLRLGQREVGFQVLDYVARSLPDDTALQARKAELERQFGR
jgi:membrane-associated phospholipid phosphatase